MKDNLESFKQAIEIWNIFLPEHRQETGACRNLLNREEQERAAKFRKPDDAAGFILCRGLLRKILAECLQADPAELHFDRTAQGKPFLRESGLEFNVSHSRDRLLIAVTAGRAVGVMSAIRGAQGVRVADIDRGRAIDLADTINSKLRPGICRVVEPGVGELRAALKDVHLFVDATPLGLKPGDDASIDVAWINPGALVYDLVYNLPVTGLVSAARAAGMSAESGLGMLLYQGAIAFELWTGEKAPIEVMKDSLEKH